MANVAASNAHVNVRRSSLLARHLDELVALLLILASTPFAALLSKAPFAVPNLNILDDSWQVDLVYKALRGVWLDHSVVFTYGPLYQLITAIPVRVLGFSLGHFYATRFTILIWTTVLLTLFTAKLLLGTEPAWKRALFLVLVVGYWSPLQIRTSAELLFFAVFLTSVLAVVERRPQVLMRGALCAVCLICAFLLAADVGAYTTVGFCIALGSGMIAAWRVRASIAALAKFALLVLAGCLVLAVGANMLLRDRVFGFQFLRDAYEMVSSYRWMEAAGLRSHHAQLLLWTLAACLCVYAIAFLRRDADSCVLLRRPAFLVSSLLFGMVLLQSALVRSGWQNITMGVFPLIFFTLAIVLGGPFRSALGDAICVLLAIAVTGAVAGPVDWIRPRNVLANYARAGEGCRGVLLDGACFQSPSITTGDEPGPIAAAAKFLEQSAVLTDSVMVFPYQNMVGTAAQRRVAGGVLQNYLVGGEYLTRRQMEGFEAERPKYALYFADGPGVFRVDGVTNFTRTPDVWFYMQRHYRAQKEVAPGVLVLVRDDARSTQQQTHALTGIEKNVAVSGEEQTIDLGKIDWPDDADFLKLTMNLRYPASWRVRKPARVAVILQLADGTQKQSNVVMRPNAWSEVWMYRGEEEELAGFFYPAPGVARPAAGRAVVSVQIRISKMDAISVMPSRVVVAKAEAVSLSR